MRTFFHSTLLALLLFAAYPAWAQGYEESNPRKEAIRRFAGKVADAFPKGDALTFRTLAVWGFEAPDPYVRRDMTNALMAAIKQKIPDLILVEREELQKVLQACGTEMADWIRQETKCKPEGFAAEAILTGNVTQFLGDDWTGTIEADVKIVILKTNEVVMQGKFHDEVKATQWWIFVLAALGAITVVALVMMKRGASKVIKGGLVEEALRLRGDIEASLRESRQKLVDAQKAAASRGDKEIGVALQRVISELDGLDNEVRGAPAGDAFVSEYSRLKGREKMDDSVLESLKDLSGGFQKLLELSRDGGRPNLTLEDAQQIQHTIQDVRSRYKARI
ncbi:MAG: hypothetical protein GMKNLPBB_01907 [Myxococcota bacterium]|nr:hypothetical protein [Myxococcota bacterium]